MIMTVESCLLLRLWLKEQKHGQMLDKFQWQCSISEVYLWTIIFSWQVIFKLSTCNLYDDSDIKGGYDGSDSHDSILQFNPDDGSWTQVGQLQTARHYHGASVVSVDDIIDYCNWFHNFIFNIKKFSIILYLDLITLFSFIQQPISFCCCSQILIFTTRHPQVLDEKELNYRFS